MTEAFCIISKEPAEFLLKKDGYSFYRCPGCGFVFIHPLPQSEVIKGLYSKESGYQANKGTAAFHVKSSKKDRAVINYLKSKNQKGKLLDIGASSGDFLFFAKEVGLETKGIEINERTGKIAQHRGLDVFIGSFADASFSPQSFDFIFLGDIIEHVPDPRVLLEHCKNLLAEDGRLVISTPNLDSLWARLTYRLYTWFGIPWSVLTPPHHLYQFSENNLDLLLSLYGFRKEKTWFFKPPRFLYEIGSLHLWKRAKERRSFGSISFFIFAFLSYVCIYIADVVYTPFKKKDFAMVSVYHL